MANQLLFGFERLADVAAERVSTVGADVINTAIQQSVAEHNRQMDAMLSLFCTRTTQFSIRYRTPTAARLQGVDESGRARPIRWAGHYDVAFPLQAGAAAWGGTDVAVAKMTVQEANDATATLTTADARWVRDHILAALFASSDWTFTDDEHGSLTIHGLANGDAVTYLLMDGADAGATDTHYLAQASAIDSSHDPFPTIWSDLTEHPENSGECVALIPSGLKTAVMGLAGYNPVANANIRPGANSDMLVGSLGVGTPGTVFGYHDSGVWLVEWRAMVANYIVAVMTAGERPLAMREDPEPELRGFNQVGTRNDHPFQESQWRRRAGFGGYNRVGAVCYYIGGGSWAVPSNYGSPMA